MMIGDSLLTSHSPMQDVAPSAVRIALAMDTIICAINFAVSFLLIFTSFLFYPFTFLLFNLIQGAAPKTEPAPKLKSIAGLIVFRIRWGRDDAAAIVYGP